MASADGRITTRFSLGIVAQLESKARELKVSPSGLVKRFVEQGLGIEVIGPVEAQTRKDVAALTTAHPMGEALSAIAFRLAREIDYGNPFALAQLSKELRATLEELADYGDHSDDDDDLASLFDDEDEQ